MGGRIDGSSPPFTNLWLLWLGAGLNATMTCYGFSVTYSMIVMLFCWVIWLLQTAGTQIVVCSFLFGVVDIFFREVEQFGASKIPLEGPIIFACAPHANQLFDPLVVTKCTDNFANRKISFIAAAHTMRRSGVGMLARGFGCIPVERAQDLAKKCVGFVRFSQEPNKIYGRNTTFTKDFLPGDIIKIEIGKGESHPVESIISDTELIIRSDTHVVRSSSSKEDQDQDNPMTSLSPFPSSSSISDTIQEFKYQWLPHIDHSQMYETVFDKLGAGGAIGIFPEGGSHDRTHLLPFKSGISIMALGAIAKYPGMKLKIIPVGLNYEYGHRFRSKVILDFGDPIDISPTFVSQYKQGGDAKNLACAALLEQVRTALKSVTIETPDFQTLRMIKLLTRIINPPEISHLDRVIMIREIAAGYLKTQNDSRVKNLMENLESYDKSLKSHGIRDHQVEQNLVTDDKEYAALLLISRLFLSFCYLLAVLPALIFSSPVLGTAKIVSIQKAKDACKKSSIKLAGRDVIATWKVLIGLVMVPCVHILYTCVAYYYGGERLALLYFFFAPFVCGVGIKCTENGIRVYKSIWVLFLVITGKRNASQLVERRQALKQQIIDVMTSCGWSSRGDHSHHHHHHHESGAELSH